MQKKKLQSADELGSTAVSNMRQDLNSQAISNVGQLECRSAWYIVVRVQLERPDLVRK